MTLRLLKNEERRLLAGHLWIYSNEVDQAKTPLKSLQPGQQVTVENYQGKALGVAYVNPHSLICGRLISRNPQEFLNRELFVKRLTAALALRERLFAKPYYRLVFAEGDYLPGLIVDRFNDVLVAQINTAGMAAVQDELIAALQEVIKPSSILLRNDSSQRLLEGLTQEVVAAVGSPPKEVLLEENGLQFYASIWEGQKTGWFYDHRMNRARLSTYVKNKRVLDVFSYTGAWGVLAAKYGASEVVCVDSSATALQQVQRHAELNGVNHIVKTQQGDAFAILASLLQVQEKFDVVILDPPAFIKRRKDSKEGLLAYQRINELAVRLLVPAGVLVSASCSMHLAREDLLNVLRRAAVKQQRNLSIVEQGHQGPDHPIHPAISETEYLKAFIAIG